MVTTVCRQKMKRNEILLLSNYYFICFLMQFQNCLNFIHNFLFVALYHFLSSLTFVFSQWNKLLKMILNFHFEEFEENLISTFLVLILCFLYAEFPEYIEGMGINSINKIKMKNKEEKKYVRYNKMKIFIELDEACHTWPNITQKFSGKYYSVMKNVWKDCAFPLECIEFFAILVIPWNSGGYCGYCGGVYYIKLIPSKNVILKIDRIGLTFFSRQKQRSEWADC